MPLRHLDEEKISSYDGIIDYRLSRLHLRRGPRGALHTNPAAKRRLAWTFYRFDWERSEHRISLRRTPRLNHALDQRRRERDERTERARPAAWAFYRRSRAWRIHAGFDAVVAPAPKAVAGPDPRRTVTLSLELPASLVATLEELAAECSAADTVSGGFTSHGPLTVEGLLAMLAEDAGMVLTRPGSWEGANMATVLSSHGYL